MIYKSIKHYLLNDAHEYDLLARVTQHPNRPKPLRSIDQIFMLPGSQLNQAKLVAPYVGGRKQIVFVGDGDAMALVLSLLAKEKIIEGPDQILVLDFDERIVSFVNETAREFGLHDVVEAKFYNVIDPIPSQLMDRYDAFYTNPPYGSRNRGKSAISFLTRCLALCKPVGSSGIAVLPYRAFSSWSAPAMLDVQGFMQENGYVVGDMLREMHLYHLDDSPELRSATVVFDRVERRPTPFLNQALPESLTQYFYGSANTPVPDRINHEATVIYREK